MFKLFTRKKQLQRKQAIIDSLKAQNSRLRVEIADNRDKYDKAIEALNMECEDLTKEVKENESIITQLRQQIADNRDEYNKTLEEKEAERRELCDQLGQQQQEVKAVTIELNETRGIVAELQKKLDFKRDIRGRFAKKGCHE